MKTNILYKILFIIAGLIPAVSLPAKVTLSEIFSDNMVLQQQAEAPIWGRAEPGKEIRVVPSWDNQTYAVRSDEAGKWMVKLKTPAAGGGPYSISISDGEELTLKNVLTGEVWICSGQSNMEMSLTGPLGKVLNHEAEIASAAYSGIRLLQIEKATAALPLDEVRKTAGGWQECSPATVAGFSAAAYFFGRHLFETLNVPIGLINTSWGGTVAEAWTGEEALEYMPDFSDGIREVRSRTDAEAIELYEKKQQEWDVVYRAAEKRLESSSTDWMEANYDDSDWKTMHLPDVWEKQGLAGFDGIVWFRKILDIPAAWAGKGLQLSLAKIDDSDVACFNGTEVGATAVWNTERIYTVPGKLVKKGKAVISIRVTDTGGDGGVFGEKEQLFLAQKSTPGSNRISLSGDWKYQTVIDFKDFPKKPEHPFSAPNRPTVLFNAMIHPLVPYAIQGAIWYQGESNADRPAQYRELFPLMIRDWRKQWQKDFPFYFVQLANFREPQTQPVESGWAELREAQLQALNLENTGMAVTIDIGDAADIHPQNKQEVGRRLALNAEANTYGKKTAFSGPVYESFRIEGDKIRIFFKHSASGLKTGDGAKVKGFAIAGPDHRFHWADASVEGTEIVVCSPQTPFPVAVRYAWADNPEGNLYNGDGLPASPFRTDND
jgi:sialate O-acetylesterase